MHFHNFIYLLPVLRNSAEPAVPVRVVFVSALLLTKRIFAQQIFRSRTAEPDFCKPEDSGSGHLNFPVFNSIMRTKEKEEAKPHCRSRKRDGNVCRLRRGTRRIKMTQGVKSLTEGAPGRVLWKYSVPLFVRKTTRTGTAGSALFRRTGSDGNVPWGA